MKDRVLKFSDYHKLFEADAPAPAAAGTPAAPASPAAGTPAPAEGAKPAAPAAETKPTAEDLKPNKSTQTADVIIVTFFQLFTTLANKVEGGYKDGIDDLQSINNEKDVTKIGDKLNELINKVLGSKIKPEYSDISADGKSAAASLQKAYNTLIATPDGKKSEDGIKSAVQLQVTGFIKQLIANATAAKADAAKVEAAKPEAKAGNVSSSLKYGDNLAALNEGLFDKQTWVEQRTDYANQLQNSVVATADQFKDSTSDTLKSETSKISAEATKEIERLKNTKEWEDMKRKERKEELALYPAKIEDLKNKLMTAVTAGTKKLEIDQNVKNAMDDAAKSIQALNDKIKADDAKAQEAALKKAAEEKAKADKEKEDKEKADKDKAAKDSADYKEIVSGTVKGNEQNLKKSGENYKAIQEFQTQYNDMFPSGAIKADGGYGGNTEKAVKEVAVMLTRLTGVDLIKATEDGKKLTSELRKAIANFKANKDKLKDLIVSK
jgi:hypothetical protein